LLHLCVRFQASDCLFILLPKCQHLIDVKNNKGQTPSEIARQFWDAVVKRVADEKAATEVKKADDDKRVADEKDPMNTGIINIYLFIYPSIYFSISFLLYLSVSFTFSHSLSCYLFYFLSVFFRLVFLSFFDSGYCSDAKLSYGCVKASRKWKVAIALLGWMHVPSI